MVEVVQMSVKEADRYAVIQQVIERTMTQADAALWLNLSVRQVKRVVRAIRQQGVQGAVSKRWGVPSNRRIAPSVREHFVDLVARHYSDFGPTLACEYLVRDHGYTGSAETLRGWMMQADLWKAKRSKVRRIHSPRTRRSRLGELVQIDGSPHAWLEDRAAKCCLIAFVDDATGQLMQACFYPVESTSAYLHSLRCYIASHGRPVALYSDRHSIFTKHDPEDPAPTQFERAVGQLGVESILAYSPQAKGRVERAFQTLQDRLVKALRVAGICSIKAANAWLPQYVAQHNARFKRVAADSADAHRVCADAPLALSRICAHHYERKLSKTLTCQFMGKLLVVITPPEQPRYALRSQRVQIIEHLDGALEMLWGTEALPFKTFERHEHLRASRVADDKLLNGRVDTLLAKQARKLSKLQVQIVADNAQLLHKARTGARSSQSAYCPF
jgi:Helix-turn-helix domain